MSDIVEESNRKMQKTISALSALLSKMRSGRAHPNMLDALSVDCYGAKMPLAQLATVTGDSQSLHIAPWDKENLASIEKAIGESDWSLNPAREGAAIRVKIPPLSEERRHELIKLVNKESEASRVSLRKTRRDSIGAVREQVKNKAIGEDEGHRLEQQIDTLIDSFSAKIDDIVKEKQQELSQI